MQPEVDLDHYAQQLDQSFTAASLLPPQEKVKAVAELWKTIPENVTTQLAERYPDLVGNQDGVPFAVRVSANRARMTRDRDELRARSVNDTLNGAGRLRLTAMDGLLASTGPTTDPVTGEVKPGRYRDFVLYDPANLGRLVEIDGDLTTAPNVGVFIPGMLNSLNIFDTLSVPAGRVREEAGAAQTVAITWLGYEPPDGPGGLLKNNARAASRDLKSFMYALENETRPEARTTVLAHSYGTVVARYAFQGGEPRVDAVALAGSPGLGKSIDSAASLGFRDKKGDQPPLIVTRAVNDLISLLQPHHHDPAEFADAIRANPLGGGDRGDGHVSYYGVNTQSLKNMAYVISGEIANIPRTRQEEHGLGRVIASVGVAIGPAAAAVQAVAHAVQNVTRTRRDPATPVRRELLKPTEPTRQPRLDGP